MTTEGENTKKQPKIARTLAYITRPVLAKYDLIADRMQIRNRQDVFNFLAEEWLARNATFSADDLNEIATRNPNFLCHRKGSEVWREQTCIFKMASSEDAERIVRFYRLAFVDGMEDHRRYLELQIDLSKARNERRDARVNSALDGGVSVGPIDAVPVPDDDENGVDVQDGEA